MVMDQGRMFRRAFLGDVNDEGLVHVLAAGEGLVEDVPQHLVGRKRLLDVGIPRNHAQSDVGSIELPAQRVLVSAEDELFGFIDEVVGIEQDESGRSARAFDPYFARLMRHRGGRRSWRGAGRPIYRRM
jgi:hypothetical protein